MNTTIVLSVAGTVFVILLVWTIASWYVVRDIETPTYSVIEKHDGYEIRRYEPYIVAEATVHASSEREALNQGFRIVADYIFGNNSSEKKVSMTSPVLSGEQFGGTGEKIAMTAPVLAEGEAGERTVAFVMPSKYTLETLPTPNTDAVTLRQIGTTTVAARRFSWYATNGRIASEKEALINTLTRDGRSVDGGPYYAGYNPPLTIPFMQHHEVMVRLKTSD